MNKYHVLLLVIMLSASSGCATRYGIGNVSDHTSHLAKPNYTDTSSVIQKAVFISGKYANSGPDAYQEGENTQLFTVKAYKSVVYKSHDFSFGGFGYYGDYKVENVPGLNGQKNLYGLGLLHEGNFRIGKKRKGFHAGYRMSLWYEDGAYDQFRRDFDDLGDDFVNLHPQRTNLYLGFQLKGFFTNQTGLYFSSGMISALNNPEATPLYGFGLFTSEKRWTFELSSNYSTELFYGGLSVHYNLTNH